MRKPPLYFAAWVAAGIGAVALTSAAVSQVGDQVTGSRPAPLSADDVRAELDAEEAAAATTTTRVTDTSADSGPSSTTATTPPASPSTTTTGPAPAPVPSQTRTFTLTGGTATLRFEPSGVSVVTATPNAGFSVEVEPDDIHPGGIEVEFRSASHESKVEGWWDGGPRSETSEEARD